MELIEVLNADGIEKAVKHLVDVKGYSKEKRLLSVFAARKLQYWMPKISMETIDVAERYANGLATWEELEKAHDVAGCAADHAWSDAGQCASLVSSCVASAASVACLVAAAEYTAHAVESTSNLYGKLEKQAYWQAVEAKFRELFGDKPCTRL